MIGHRSSVSLVNKEKQWFGKVRNTVDGLKILPRLIVQFLSLRLQLLEPAFGVGVDRILCMLAEIKPLSERLRSSHDALLKALDAHGRCDSGRYLYAVRTR